MYEVLKYRLENDNYLVEDAQKRIDYAVARGSITVEQAEELQTIATNKGETKIVTAKSLDQRVTDLEDTIMEILSTFTLKGEV